MSKPQRILTAQQLATFFTQLKQLESAGLPAFQIVETVSQSETKLKKPLAIMQQQLTAGRPIAEAGFRAGIFNDTHKTLVHAAESSGRLAELYGNLAGYYTNLSNRIKKVKTRLYLPALVLTLSLFFQPLPELIGSQISGITYLQMSLGRLLVIGMSILLLVRLPAILPGLGIETAWHRLQLRIPVVANWLIKRQINDFFFILAMMLESGLPFADALPKAVASIKNSCLREKFIPALSIGTAGASVVDTLAKVPVINATTLSILSSAEKSGKLSSSIFHFTQLETETISLQHDALAEWIPRLIYSMIAIWMAYSLLTSQIVTVLPSSI